MAEAKERMRGDDLLGEQDADRADLPVGQDARQRIPTGSTLADLKFPPDALLELVGLVENKTISSSAAQQVFIEMFDSGKAPAAIVQEKGLAIVSDTGAIEKFCDDAIAANPGPAADFRAGKAAALNFLKGQVMKASKGKANPALVGEILERKLKG
jgi:aspartyl-tRNA(Asn)/glutamyl-tRNA(Gln) amidotransferase subunit B